MARGLSNQAITRKQPAAGRLHWFKKSAGRRAKKLHLRISFSRQIIISLRQFRTRPEKRSKRTRQLVIPFHALRVREIAFTVDRRKRARKGKSPAHSTFLWVPARAVLPMIPIVIGASGVIYFGLNMHQPVRLDIAPTTSSAPAPLAVPQQQVYSKAMSPSKPVRLTIPKIAVDTEVTSTGLGQSGAIQMPERYDITAWYTGSPTPGELGPAIIAGHVDSFKGTGIFFRLRELQPGDTVSVSRVDGTTATFKITSLEQYPKNSFPTQKVYGNITYAGIRLITCGGAFDSQTYEYTDNIVAYGELQ
jgi:sortase (surface protein transpeptidase)